MPLISTQQPPYYEIGSGTNNEIKQYIANLTQSGTDAPVPNILVNTLGASIVWTRSAIGIYVGTITGAFPNANKVSCIITAQYAVTLYSITSENTIEIATADPTTTDDSDDYLTNSTIQITVYP